MRHYFGWVGVGGALFFVGKNFGRVGVGGDEWG